MRTLLVLCLLLPGLARAEIRSAYFAGGCFWCVEADFDKVPGVVETVSGYTGGKEANPTYESVSAHATGHVEAVEVRYDSAKVSYAQLLDWFWHHIDPLTANAQFCDHGPQYRSVIFYRDAAEQALAERTKAEHARALQKPIATEIAAAGRFWPAENYHQDYYRKNPLRYKYYRLSCGRDARLEQVWGKKP